MIVYRVTFNDVEECEYFALKKDAEKQVDGPNWRIEKIVVNNRRTLAHELNLAIMYGPMYGWVT